MTQPLTTTDLEELLEGEVSCQGIANEAVARSCSRAAVVRCVGHECPKHARLFKCLECWQTLYMHLSRFLADYGSIICVQCKGNFYTVDSFSDYRPF